MKEPTEQFKQAVRRAWGNPRRVTEAGISETFNHPDVFGFDHDDQVNNAARIGVTAGLTASNGPEAFIEAFTKILNEDA